MKVSEIRDSDVNSLTTVKSFAGADLAVVSDSDEEHLSSIRYEHERRISLQTRRKAENCRAVNDGRGRSAAVPFSSTIKPFFLSYFENKSVTIFSNPFNLKYLKIVYLASVFNVWIFAWCFVKTLNFYDSDFAHGRRQPG